jgi:hypothetical protein
MRPELENDPDVIAIRSSLERLDKIGRDLILSLVGISILIVLLTSFVIYTLMVVN